MQASSMPVTVWYLRWIPWVVTAFACVGYLSGVWTTRPFSLLTVLLLTATYGAWLLIYHCGVRRLSVPAHPGFLLALFSLACASQFIPGPATDTDWLPLLALMTASFMTVLQPQPLGLALACALCLSSYLAIRRLVPDWGVGSQVGLVLAFFSLCGYAVIIRELALAHQAKDVSNTRLAAANARLQEYSAQVEELSVIRERNRIAREIHDTLGHALTLLSVQLETATRLQARGDPRVHEELAQARQVARACLKDIRRSVQALRPDEDSAGSFQEHLQGLVAACEAACPQTRITLDLDEARHALTPDLRLTLYRCAQEALTNVRKHAHATRVLVRLSTSDGPQGQVELTILDDGQGGGMLPTQAATGFGLQGMRERVTLLSGTLRAGSEPGRGWRVEVLLPRSLSSLEEGCVSEVRDGGRA